MSPNLSAEKETASRRCGGGSIPAGAEGPRRRRTSWAGGAAGQTEHREGRGGLSQATCHPASGFAHLPSSFNEPQAHLQVQHGLGFSSPKGVGDQLEGSSAEVGCGPVLQHLGGKGDLPTSAYRLPSPLMGRHDGGQPGHRQVPPIPARGFPLPLGHPRVDSLSTGQRLAATPLGRR